MIRPLAALLICSLLLMSCASERFSQSTLKVRAFELNARALGSPTSVRMKSDSGLRSTTYFNILADSTMWLDPVTEAPVVVSTRDMREIVMRDRQKGLLYGMAIGAGVGAAGGLATMDPNNADSDKIVVLTTLVGALVGEILGVAIGWRTSYVIE